MSYLQQTVPDETASQFLHLCLRGRWDTAALKAASVLAKHDAVDWKALSRIAYDARLTPLLYRIIRGRDLVPPSFEADWRRAYLHVAHDNIVLFHELEGILSRLAEEGVDVILLKGAALSQAVYGNVAVRPMDDLDLLVSRQDTSVILRVLSKLGYWPLGVELHAGTHSTFENEMILQKPGIIRVLIELHWSLFDSPFYQQGLPMEWFWQTALLVDVGRSRALVLGPEAQILHLCGHLLLHHGSGGEPELLWLHDVAEVITFFQDQIDWEELLSFAQACDLVLPLQRILPQVADEWNALVPSDVLARLQVLPVSEAEAQVVAWLTAKRRPVAQRFWADLGSMPNWRWRLRFAWVNLFPSPGYMRHRYQIPHPLLVPLYYPYRWLVGLRSVL